MSRKYFDIFEKTNTITSGNDPQYEEGEPNGNIYFYTFQKVLNQKLFYLICMTFHQQKESNCKGNK